MSSEAEIGDEEMTPTQTAKFMLHIQKHGLSYAIVALLLESSGLLEIILTQMGGMC
jgi:hypothetical protein